MSTSVYPEGIDNDSNLPVVLDNITEIGGDAINALRSSIIAIETAIGVNPQGSQTNLTERLFQVINDDGTFKAAALLAAGLISLPITNAQIGSSAAIEESKLNLNYTTNALQLQITSNDVDISNLQASLATDIARLSSHIIGSAYKHDGYQVTISGLTNKPNILTVEDALTFIYDAFLSHKSSVTNDEHNASAIRYNPNATSLLSSTDVQSAIDEVDGIIISELEKHYTLAHGNGISSDGYTLHDGQVNFDNIALRLTRYQSAGGATDITKLGLVNAANVITRGFSPSAINATYSAIKITAEIGTATRSITISNLHTARYPAASTILTLDGIVSYINEQVATLSEHFPISAYSINGELAIQHNIARADCTLKIENPVSLGALEALGFSDISGIIIAPTTSNIFVINGNQYSELKTKIAGTGTQSTLSSSVDLGSNITSTGVDVKVNNLIHIYSHTNAAANGTYRILQISPASPSPSTTIGLATSLAAGTFSYIIYEDTAVITLSGSPRVVDIALDENARVIVVDRAQVTPGGLGGVRIIHISKDFPIMASGGLMLTTGATQREIFFIDSDQGESTFFDTGYIGYIKIASHDNNAFAIALVNNLSPTNGIDYFTNIASAENDNLMILGSTYFDASAVIELPYDTRSIGLIDTTSLSTNIVEGLIERDISSYHINGVVSGFETISADAATNVTVSGGQAYVNGHFFSKARETVFITRTATVNGVYNLTVNATGQYALFSNTLVGFTLRDIYLSKELLAIAQITITSSVISLITDVRLVIKNNERQMPSRVDSGIHGFGQFENLTSAAKYADTISAVAKSKTEIVSTYTETLAVTISTEVVAYNDVTFNSTLLIDSGATFEIFGTATFLGDVTIGTGSTLILHSIADFSTNLILGNLSKLKFDSNINLRNITMSGNFSSIVGNEAQPYLIFDGTQTGIIISGDSINIADIRLSMPDAAFTLVSLTSTAQNASFRNCTFAQDYSPINETNWAVNARAGIRLNTTTAIDRLKIVGCEFYNLSIAISGEDGTTAAPHTSFTNMIVDTCRFTYCGAGIYIESGENILVVNSYFYKLKTQCIKVPNITANTVKNMIIESCIFESYSTTSTAIVAVDILAGDDNIIISKNIFRDIITSGSIIVLNGAPDGCIVSDNLITACTTTTYAIISNAAGSLGISNNMVLGHTGPVISASNAMVDGNTFISSHTVGGSVPVVIGSIDAGTANPSVWSNNRFSLTTNQQITLGSFQFSNNTVLASHIVLNDSIDTSGFNICDNTLILNGVVSTSISLFTASTSAVQNHLSNNIIKSSSTVSNIFINEVGRFIIDGNSIINSTALECIVIGTGSSSSGSAFSITNNNIECNTGNNNAISINSNNAIITGNVIYGNGCNSNSILVATAISNILISGNYLNSGGAGSALITHQDTNPTSTLILENKNANSVVVHSALSAQFEEADWTFNTGVLQSATTSSYMYLVIDGIPTGTKINSVTVYLDTPTAGAVSCELGYRNSASTSIQSLSATTVNTTTGPQNLVITPTAHSYIRKNTEYFLYITTSDVATKIGIVSTSVTY